MRKTHRFVGVLFACIALANVLWHEQSGRTAGELAASSIAEYVNKDSPGKSQIAAPLAEVSLDAEAVTGSDSPANELIEALSPSQYRHRSNEFVTYLDLYDADLEPVDSTELYFQNSTYLIDYLLKYSHITGAFNGMELEITSSYTKDDLLTVRFRQFVHGIPVQARGRIAIRNNGEVARLRTWILNPDSIQSMPTILEDEAIAHAKYAIGIELGSDKFDAVIYRPDPDAGDAMEPPTIYYETTGPLDEPPEPYWNIELVSEDGVATHYAKVNAETGETIVVPYRDE